MISRFCAAPATALLLAFAVLVGPPAAGAAQGAGLTAQDQGDIKRIETYINSINTLKARFIQLNPNGRFVQGSLFISRPGRMRFEYDPPIPYQLIADGNQVIFYDSELETPTYVSMSDTPLDIILAEQVSLSRSVTVTEVARGPGTLRVTIVQSDKPDQGAVQITFSERPFELRKWSLIDQQGTAIHIALLDMEYGVNLDPKLFEFKNPKIYRDEDQPRFDR